MKKIELPFQFDAGDHSVACFQFPVDMQALSDESFEVSEFPCFFLDLRTGEVLGVSQEISCGKALRYENSESWLVEGNGWWIGFSESEGADFIEAPNEEIKVFLESQITSTFKAVVENVLELSRDTDLTKLAIDGLYQKYINNEDSPSL